MEEFLSMDYHINLWLLFLVAIISFILGYFAISSLKDKIKKICISLIYFSLFFYSGIGISILKDYHLYLFYYITYLIVFTIFIRKFSHTNIPNLFSTQQLNSFITKYGSFFIILYITLSFINLIHPENKLSNLISPPVLDRSIIDDFGTGSTKRTAIQALILFITNVIQPFYYISLYKYREKILKLFIFIFLPIYFQLCAFSYVSRTQLIVSFLIYLTIIYYFNPQKRKLLISISVSSIIILLPFIAVFSQIRNGEGYDNIEKLNFMDSLDLLFRIECSFPLWFNDIYHNHITHTIDYLLYILFQPIPGFIKQPIIGNFQVNYAIAELLLGVEMEEDTFFIPLSGNICESIFIFGKYFFFIHAIICAYILNIAINFFNKMQPLKILAIAFIFSSCLLFGRIGTTGGSFYPFIIKSVIYINVAIILLSPRKQKQ